MSTRLRRRILLTTLLVISTCTTSISCKPKQSASTKADGSASTIVISKDLVVFKSYFKTFPLTNSPLTPDEMNSLYGRYDDRREVKTAKIWQDFSDYHKRAHCENDPNKLALFAKHFAFYFRTFKPNNFEESDPLTNLMVYMKFMANYTIVAQREDYGKTYLFKIVDFLTQYSGRLHGQNYQRGISERDLYVVSLIDQFPGLFCWPWVARHAKTTYSDSVYNDKITQLKKGFTPEEAQKRSSLLDDFWNDLPAQIIYGKTTPSLAYNNMVADVFAQPQSWESLAMPQGKGLPGYLYGKVSKGLYEHPVIISFVPFLGSIVAATDSLADLIEGRNAAGQDLTYKGRALAGAKFLVSYALAVIDYATVLRPTAVSFHAKFAKGTSGLRQELAAIEQKLASGGSLTEDEVLKLRNSVRSAVDELGRLEGQVGALGNASAISEQDMTKLLEILGKLEDSAIGKTGILEGVFIPGTFARDNAIHVRGLMAELQQGLSEISKLKDFDVNGLLVATRWHDIGKTTLGDAGELADQLIKARLTAGKTVDGIKMATKEEVLTWINSIPAADKFFMHRVMLHEFHSLIVLEKEFRLAGMSDDLIEKMRSFILWHNDGASIPGTFWHDTFAAKIPANILTYGKPATSEGALLTLLDRFNQGSVDVTTLTGGPFKIARQIANTNKNLTLGQIVTEAFKNNFEKTLSQVNAVVGANPALGNLKIFKRGMEQMQETQKLFQLFEINSNGAVRVRELEGAAFTSNFDELLKQVTAYNAAKRGLFLPGLPGAVQSLEACKYGDDCGSSAADQNAINKSNSNIDFGPATNSQ